MVIRIDFVCFRPALCFILVYNCGLTVRNKRICYVMLCYVMPGSVVLLYITTRSLGICIAWYRRISAPLTPRSVDAANKTRLPRQRPSGDRKTNFRLVIYSRNSTNREDIRRRSIRQILRQLVGRESSKKKQQQNVQPARLLLRLKSCSVNGREQTEEVIYSMLEGA